MTYHRATDPVITPHGPAIFWQYWPDGTIGKVRLTEGSQWPGQFRSYPIDQIRTPAEAATEAAAVILGKSLAAIVDEIENDLCKECGRDVANYGLCRGCAYETEAENASDRRHDR